MIVNKCGHLSFAPKNAFTFKPSRAACKNLLHGASCTITAKPFKYTGILFFSTYTAEFIKAVTKKTSMCQYSYFYTISSLNLNADSYASVNLTERCHATEC